MVFFSMYVSGKYIIVSSNCLSRYKFCVFGLCSSNENSTLHFYEVDCRGTENSFKECEFVEQTNQPCKTRRFVGIHCSMLKLFLITRWHYIVVYY